MMIIELFGPPAAGKTTFARALARQLKQCGRSVEVLISYRPAETDRTEMGSEEANDRTGGGQNKSGHLPYMAVMHRLARPTIEWLTTKGKMTGCARGTSLATELLNLMPTRSLMWSVRLRQYILRLEDAWRRAAQSEAIVIVDQGFVQAVCSLVLLGRAPAPCLAEQALAMIPHPDLLIRLDAPRDLLRTRLEARRRAQSWIEQPLELDTETSLRSVEIVEMLDGMLRRRNQDVVSVECGERGASAAALDEIERDVMAKMMADVDGSRW